MRRDLRAFFPQPVTILHDFISRIAKAILGHTDPQVWECPSGSDILFLLFLAHRYRRHPYVTVS